MAIGGQMAEVETETETEDLVRVSGTKAERMSSDKPWTPDAMRPIRMRLQQSFGNSVADRRGLLLPLILALSCVIQLSICYKQRIAIPQVAGELVTYSFPPTTRQSRLAF